MAVLVTTMPVVAEPVSALTEGQNEIRRIRRWLDEFGAARYFDGTSRTQARRARNSLRRQWSCWIYYVTYGGAGTAPMRLVNSY